MITLGTLIISRKKSTEGDSYNLKIVIDNSSNSRWFKGDLKFQLYSLFKYWTTYWADTFSLGLTLHILTTSFWAYSNLQAHQISSVRNKALVCQSWKLDTYVCIVCNRYLEWHISSACYNMTVTAIPSK